MADYDPHAITEAERIIDRIVAKHPDTRADLELVKGVMTGTWARLAMVRQAVK